MNKQQLASKIWESANKMRSKIEANEYKDYILGFIFYKFLSDREVKYLKSQDWDNDYMRMRLHEEYDPAWAEDGYSEAEHRATVEGIQKAIGYFIGYENLFDTWLSMGSDFNVDNPWQK
jgi:type I restriction enzyme M protein